jgi:hypothetical protein
MNNKKLLIWVSSLLTIICILLVFVLLVDRRSFFSSNENSVDSSDDKEMLHIQYFQPIQGTSTFIATVNQERDWVPNISQRWFSFDYGFSVRNVVFLDGNTLDSFYLFNNNENYISDITQLPKPYSYQDSQTIAVKWLAYRIVHGDTNSDGYINSSDSFSIAISDANGKNYVELIQDVNSINGMDSLDEHYLLVSYIVNGRHFASKIDLNEKGIIKTSEIKTIPSGQAP